MRMKGRNTEKWSIIECLACAATAVAMRRPASIRRAQLRAARFNSHAPCFQLRIFAPRVCKRGAKSAALDACCDEMRLDDAVDAAQ